MTDAVEKITYCLPLLSEKKVQLFTRLVNFGYSKFASVRFAYQNNYDHDEEHNEEHDEEHGDDWAGRVHLRRSGDVFQNLRFGEVLMKFFPDFATNSREE